MAEELTGLIEADTRVVSVMLGNNETGVLQPIERMSAICSQAGVPLHTDAVQVAGKMPLNFRELGASAMTISAHKFHGPVGIGALLVRRGVELQPLLHGGFQQAGLRPGTEAVALAVGMHSALIAWQRDTAGYLARLTALRDEFERELLAACPELSINGAGAGRLPHTSNVAFSDVDGQALVMALDLAGIACSTGSACASGSSKPSPALVAMGLSRERYEGSVRFSFGRDTTRSDVAEAVRRILRVYNDLRLKNSTGKNAWTGRKGQGDSV